MQNQKKTRKLSIQKLRICKLSNYQIQKLHGGNGGGGGTGDGQGGSEHTEPNRFQ